MRVYYGIIGLLCCLLWSCQPTPQLAHRYDEGVSKELATLRKQEIKELKYDLRFSIPKQKRMPIEGAIKINFVVDKAQEIILDFREAPEKIKEVLVNGETTVYEVRNEHILIPSKAIRKGRNEVTISFTAGDQSLNRNEEFVYTLLVPDRARTVFPCFEQPDLKAVFSLQLEVPAEWKAVSNTYINKEEIIGERKTVSFAPTEPLSTYLFSFVTGKLEQRTYQEGERKISAYYRESDPKKTAQLDLIFKQVVASLQWLEAYTDIPYPFAKYDFIILPGFQYGGMEHTGATLYNDKQLFLSEHPTPDEELRRAQLIAHETAHMWFGDLVTMAWFDDVWTKEVFANYFAACMTEPLFPTINHSLNRLKTLQAAALSEDRTSGTTSIRQPLDNLRNAGLVYGQIIYNKAPVMMMKLVELMGEAKFREGIQAYLKTYAYGNATWEDLIRILDDKTPHDLAAFSDVWVNQKGMPHISFTRQDDKLTIKQEDPYHRGLHWPQRFKITFCGERDSTVEVNLTDRFVTIPLPFAVNQVIANTDGRGYGLLMPDEADSQWLLAHWQEITDDTARQALLMQLYENYQAQRFTDEAWMDALMNGLPIETNPLIASTLISYLPLPLQALPAEKREEKEKELYALSQSHPLPSCSIQLLRMIASHATSAPVIAQLYTVWEQQTANRLTENDYMTMAYNLSLHLPERSTDILSAQRKRIANADRLREFDFISRAVVADTLQLDALFESLLQPENRRIEPWTASALGYLNHPTRETYAVKYIRPALEALQEVQRTGDIFFPRRWAGALLESHRSPAAQQAVEAFLEAYPEYPPLLKNKLMQAAYPLYRANKKQ